MIRTENEYKAALKKRDSEIVQLENYREQLKRQGVSEELIKKAMEPYESFRLNLVEEIEAYEQIKQGVISDLQDLSDIGSRLIGIRIYLDLSQRDLASRLGVHETQVSRDEKNEYHGITVQRADEILKALGVKMSSKFEVPNPKSKSG